MKKGILLGLGLLGSIILGAPQADAARVDRLAVLSVIVEGPQGEASMSSIYDDVSAAAAQRVGLTVVPNEEIFMQREETTNRIRECGSDKDCIVSRLRAFDARFGLLVTVNLAIEPAIISLQLADTDEHRLVAEVIDELKPEEKNVSGAIRARVNRIFNDLGFVKAGRIIVDVEPREAGAATIKVGEGLEPDKGTPNIFSVLPGSYPISAHLEGWDSDSGEATVASGEEVHVKLNLKEDKSIAESPWFWTAIGVVVVGAGTTAAVLATQGDATRCLCVTYMDSPCPCETN